ncbi:MAG TPA: hypothetical protein DEF47_18125 [Herpetosiphon sp.]|uniref:Uncharacterized protein n=1 Tax=Herpetosiphon aurantiacus (strain ATCC 23779 / DSM 785 / 114-95) TaxID=316274 RepID=A9B2I9_HERA2|nr:hypothetical protein [Herpetosiphon sp.]ABX04034.1 hypothetical protein Haur_1389 [Herpetosiphon aurantiacus DSM 785]HBW51812.1 hypothetical protein [Herpetosiphon sp.]
MTQPVSKRLQLNDLETKIPGLTPNMGRYLIEACSIRLEDQRHSRGVQLSVERRCDTKSDHSFVIEDWDEITPRHLAAWTDEEYTTEHAACGIACLLAVELTDYTVINRSRKGTGFDYWLAKQDGDDILPFDKHDARLEVSGIRQGSGKDIENRVKLKLRQTNPSDSMQMPAYVVVVEFSQPTARVVRK